MTDEKLDRLLRDVEIPTDLKNSLLNIPEELNSFEPTLAWPRRANWRWFGATGLLALAASIIGLAMFVFYQPHNDETTIANANLPEPENSQPLSELPEASAAQLLEQMRSNSFEIEFLVMESNVEQLISVLQAKLAPAAADLSEIDQSSVALCGAIQAGADFGSNIETVREELLQVKAKFPGTLGAKLAEQYIQKSKKDSDF